MDLIAGYKSHRVAEPVPAGLAPQVPVIYDLLEAIGVDVVGVADHEAEDVIATLTKLTTGTIEIASGDRICLRWCKTRESGCCIRRNQGSLSSTKPK